MKRVVMVLLAACGADRTPPPAVHDARVVAHADAGVDGGQPRSYVGVVTADQVVDITPRFAGVIADVKVHVGDAVTAGQVVVEMDPKSMQEELRAAQATVASARATANQALVDFKDAKRKVGVEAEAVKNGIEASEKLDEAKAALDHASAAYQKAESDVETAKSHAQTAQDHVHDTGLRAPADGTVLLRYKDPGANVAASDKILRILGHGGMLLRFAVPPDHIREFAAQGKVEAKIDTIATPVKAVIRQISPALDPASGLIFVEAELAPDPAVAPQLQPGLAAWVK